MRNLLFSCLLFLPSLLLAHNAPEFVVEDQVALIEHNFFYDQTNNLVSEQLIFWDWEKRASDFRVCDWRFVTRINQLPQADQLHGGYVSSWVDDEVPRRVRGLSVRCTKTWHEPTVTDLYFRKAHERRGLSLPGNAMRNLPLPKLPPLE